MAKNTVSRQVVRNSTKVKRVQPSEVIGVRKSAIIAEAGISTGHDYITLMSALISDVLSGRIPPQLCNAASSAARNIGKMTELELRYGGSTGAKSTIRLSKSR